jgi:hypothetical protein
MHGIRNITATTAVVDVTGRNIAHARRSAVARAFLAADLHVGRVHVVRPTLIQAAALTKVSVPYIQMALKANESQRRLIEVGAMALTMVGAPDIAETWAQRPDRREAFVQERLNELWTLIDHATAGRTMVDA